MKKDGNPALSLFKKCVLIALVAGMAFVGVQLFRFFKDQASRQPGEFPRVGATTRLLLRLEYPAAREIDASGQGAIIDALGSLKHQHIVGRSIGPSRVQGFLEIDGGVFKLDAAMIESGFRAIVENETDTWESPELGEVLYRLYAGK